MAISEELFPEWDYSKNIGMDPNEVAAQANKKAWWVCKNGHSWESLIASRYRGRGCPYCSGRCAVPGTNDLHTTNPTLAKEWNYSKNSNLDIHTVLPFSNKKAWWVCSKNHEWEASLYHRSEGKGCPFCANKKILAHYNSLSFIHPELSRQWNYSKNSADSPDNYSAGSSKKVWWVCSKKHEWKSTISSRTSGKGCPYCSGRYAVSGINDLLTQFPHLMRNIHPTKNTEIDVTALTVQSGLKIWWLGDCKHEWDMRIADFVSGKRSCPVCVNQRIVANINSLQILNPVLADQWNFAKNGNLLPSQVGVNSNLKVWWVCSKKHEWKASVVNRNRGRNCLECSYSNFSSKAEKEIYSFLASILLVPILKRNRKVISGVEIDLYVPSHKIGIEFNGLYWHSDRFNPGQAKTRHYDKWLKAKNTGIQLIQIWEDDWKKNPELIKNMLAHKFGLSTQIKVFARKTHVISLAANEARLFLDANHIQGFASGSYYFGLQDENDILVAMSVLKRDKNNVLNIIRYATAANVVGGFTKLLSYAERTLKPSAFITFSDHAVSDGLLYEKHGFVADKEIRPDYMYIVNHARKHKFGYRIKRFRDDPHLLWFEVATESELSQLNNLARIWDAGKTRWIKTYI